jgi:hypothetical protein
MAIQLLQPLKFLSFDVSGKIFYALEWPSLVANSCFTGCTVITEVIKVSKKIVAFLPTNI